MQNVQDLRSHFDTGKLPSIIIPKLFCAGMFCGLEAVAEKILTKQNAVL